MGIPYTCFFTRKDCLGLTQQKCDLQVPPPVNEVEGEKNINGNFCKNMSLHKETTSENLYLIKAKTLGNSTKNILRFSSFETSKQNIFDAKCCTIEKGDFKTINSQNCRVRNGTYSKKLNHKSTHNKPENGWMSEINKFELNEELRKYSLSKDLSLLNSAKEITSFIENSQGKNTKEKLWVLYIWMAKAISYNKGSIKKCTSYYPSLSSFKDESEIISNLAKEICTSVGINCEVVCGKYKSFRYKEKNHAWNKVKIEQQDYLIDFSLGGGYENPDGNIVKEIDVCWFLTPPEIMIYTHFPKLTDNQLLKPPVTEHQFHSLPNFSPDFFKKGFRMKSNENNVIKKQVNYFVFKIKATIPSNMIVGKIIEKGSLNAVNNCLLIQKNDEIECEVRISLKNGEYIFSLYSNKITEKNKKSLVDFVLDINSKENNCQEICKVNSPDVPIYLFEPIYRKLRAGEERTFVLKAKANEVVLITPKGEHINFCNEGNNIWSINKKKLEDKGIYKVGFLFNDSNSYEYCFDYQIE